MYKYLGSTDIRLYDFFGNISTIVLVIYNLCHIKQKKLFLGTCSQLVVNSLSKSTNFKFLSNVTLWAFIETILVTYVQYFPPYNGIVGNLVGVGANYYGIGFLAPICLMLLFYLLAVDPLKQMDLITPAFPLALIFVKIACFGQGCCRGIPWSHGLLNHKTGQLEFPVQLVESGLALLIFIFILFWQKKAKEGTLFPTYLIIYSGTRFFSEFLRGEPDIIWKLKAYHLFCIAGVIVGIIELIIVLKFGDKIREFYSTNIIIETIKKIKIKIDEYLENLYKNKPKRKYKKKKNNNKTTYNK